MKKITAFLLCLLLCFFCLACRQAGPDSAGPRAVYKAGDVVTFGSWGGEPIVWWILEAKDDGTYIMMSWYGLEALPFCRENQEVYWGTSYVRQWLNGVFYEKAFSAEEKEKIVLSTVENPDNLMYSTEGSGPTQDLVYLLSVEEVIKYFHVDTYIMDIKTASSQALICMPTEAAVQHSAATADQAWVDEYEAAYGYPLKAGACCWWLRSAGSDRYRVAGIGVGGFVGNMDAQINCVRPVICVRF